MTASNRDVCYSKSGQMRLQLNCLLCANNGHLLDDLRKQKDRLGAVSPKFDQMF